MNGNRTKVRPYEWHSRGRRFDSDWLHQFPLWENQSDLGLPITGRPDNSRGSLKNSPYSASLRLKTPATTGFSALTASNTSPNPKHACENTVCADGHSARHDDRPFSKPAAGAAACGASADVEPAPPEYLHLRRALSPARRVHRGCRFWPPAHRPPR
jgi:hypothetical protein